MRLLSGALGLSFILLMAPSSLLAQSKLTSSQPSISVPRLVKFSGIFKPADGQPPAPVEVVTLSIYAEPDGGVPLWQEIQTVMAGEDFDSIRLLIGPTFVVIEVTVSKRIRMGEPVRVST